jgi:hypothetical protein
LLQSRAVKAVAARSWIACRPAPASLASRGETPIRIFDMTFHGGSAIAFRSSGMTET